MTSPAPPSNAVVLTIHGPNDLGIEAAGGPARGEPQTTSPLVLVGVASPYLRERHAMREDGERHGAAYTFCGRHATQPVLDVLPGLFRGIAGPYALPIM